MKKHIKLFEQFIGEAFNEFVDIEKLLAVDGRIKTSLQKTFTINDKSGKSVIGIEDKYRAKDIFIEADSIEFMLSDEGSYELGETLSASLNLSLLKGLTLELDKAKMGPDFKNLKVSSGILTFDYIIPADFDAKNKKEWGGGTKIRRIDKFKEVLKGGVDKVIKTLDGKSDKDIPSFSIIIPCPSIEEYGSLTISIVFQPDTQIG